MAWTTTSRGYKTIVGMDAPNSAEVIGPDHVANARLIAAAPDLLAALQSMVLNYAQLGRVTESNIRDAARLVQGIGQ